MKYQDILIISDVDGTLLEAGFGVPKKNIEAVERFVSNGGLFTVATDRSVESVGRFVDWVPLSAPAILLCGAVLYDFNSKRFLKRRGIAANLSPIIESAYNFFGAASELYEDDCCAVIHMNEISNQLHLRDHTSYTVTDYEFIKSPVLKLRCCAGEDVGDDMADMLSSLIENDKRFDCLALHRVSRGCCDITARGVNKRIAAAELSIRLKLSAGNIAVVGDGIDDMPLFEGAGFSATVANANELLRGTADITVASCQLGGVAEFIEIVEKRYGLK